MTDNEFITTIQNIVIPEEETPIESDARYNRHAARFIAILSLYSYNMNEKKSLSLMKISEKMTRSYLNKDIFDLNLNDEQLDEIKLHAPDHQFLENLILLSVSKKEEIEGLIKANLIEKWNLDKLDQVIRAILKLASLELLYHGEIPAKIIIDEYVSLTKAFYENNEAGFVNKVIDIMAGAARPLEK